MSSKRGSNSIVHLSPKAAPFRGSATQLWRDPSEAMKGSAEVVAHYRALRDRAAEIDAIMANLEASNVQKKTLIKACRRLVERTSLRVTKVRVLAKPLKELKAKLAAFEATFSTDTKLACIQPLRADTARPGTKTATGIPAKDRGRAANRPTLSLPSKKPVG